MLPSTEIGNHHPDSPRTAVSRRPRRKGFAFRYAFHEHNCLKKRALFKLSIMSVAVETILEKLAASQWGLFNTACTGSMGWRSLLWMTCSLPGCRPNPRCRHGSG